MIRTRGPVWHCRKENMCRTLISCIYSQKAQVVLLTDKSKYDDGYCCIGLGAREAASLAAHLCTHLPAELLGPVCDISKTWDCQKRVGVQYDKNNA